MMSLKRGRDGQDQSVVSAMYQIGQVAEVVGLSLRTIRHYEEVGLVPPSGRSAGGFRLYTDGDIDRLRLIKRMKPLDFTLEEMRQLLDARAQLAEGQGDRERHLGTLAMFASLADGRCARLREELEAAEELAADLRRDARPKTRRR